MGIGVKIGTLTIDEIGPEETENHTSYAADYRVFRVLPGVYDIELHGRDVYVTQDIEVSKAVTFNGIAGNNFSSQDQGPHRTTRTRHIYGYEAAKALSESDEWLGGKAMLDPGWSIRVTYKTLPPLMPNDPPSRTYISREFYDA